MLHLRCLRRLQFRLDSARAHGVLPEAPRRSPHVYPGCIV